MPSTPDHTVISTTTVRSVRCSRAGRRGSAGIVHDSDDAGSRPSPRRGQWVPRLGPLLGVLVIVLTLAPPVLAQESGLLVGGGAEVANAGGDTVLLREGHGYDAGALDALREGTPLILTDGPITAGDGSIWYGVDAAGRTGYVVADFLAPALAEPVPAAIPEGAAPVAPVETLTMASPVAAAGDTGGETATAREAVNLRAAPNGEAPVLGVVPVGGVVTRTGDAAEGYVPVSYDGMAGYAAIAYLTLGGGAGDAAAAPVAAAQPVPEGVAPAESATTIGAVNLRAGPGAEEPVLLVVPAGAAVAPTGEAAAGFLGVAYEGTTGWIDAAYLAAAEVVATDDAVAAPSPAALSAPPALAVGDAPAGELAVANDLVNLRAGPGYGEPVLRVLPPASPVTITGETSGGFLPVWYNGSQGWIAAEFLDAGNRAEPSPEAEEPALAVPAAPSVADGAAGGGLIWPVSGGGWEIMQGYNGSSHQNNSGTWQYYYSLDLVSVDGETAGRAVRSPANGTVRWLDPSTGGISIDIGDGHAVALFHVTIDGVGEGERVSQGQYVGTISGPGGPGFAGTPHVHFALWETGDGGNWSRSAAPFVGAYAISGMAFPDTGGGNQHRGATFTP